MERERLDGEHRVCDLVAEELLAVAKRRFEVTCFATSPELVDAQRIGDAVVGFDVSCEPTGYMELELQESTSNPKITDDTEWGSC